MENKHNNSFEENELAIVDKRYIDLARLGWFSYEEDADETRMNDPENDPYAEMERQFEETLKEIEEEEGEECDIDHAMEIRSEMEREYDREPPTDWEIKSQNKSLIMRQREFQQAAEYVALSFTEFPEVLKVAAFGSIALPLEMEVPRFRKFRRAGVAVRHECMDVDLAVWISSLDKLRALQIAKGHALNRLFQEQKFGVAHHQVEVFFFLPGTKTYLGNLCNYSKCPKGKDGCRTPGCGATPFLKQYEDFRIYDNALDSGRIKILFERKKGE